MFFGTYTHTLDETGRLTIPSKLREAAAALATVSEKGPRIFLTCGAEKCIAAYTERRVTQILEEMKTGSIDRDQAREFKRIFGGEGAMETWDKQGRVLLPDGLRAYAGIKKEITIVGAVDCFEIWDAQTYLGRRDRARAAYDLIAGKVIQ